ncbi:MAG TPA: hypothetical protein VH479_00910 [Acidimicrobiales bacterium]
MSGVVFDGPRRRIVVGAWSVRPAWMRRSGPPDYRDSALIEVRHRVHLLIAVTSGRAGTPWVELWSGEPDESDGLAVVRRGDDPAGIAPIPLCPCGDRDCGDNSLQLATELAASDLPTLVDLLRSLPTVPGPPSPDAIWQGFTPEHTFDQPP